MKKPNLTFINSVEQIKNYINFHGVKFNLVEFYEKSTEEIDKLLLKGKITQSEHDSHLKCNLKMLVEFNSTYRNKPRRRKVSQKHPCEDMTLGLPEY